MEALINQELAKLQEELSLLDNAVQHISKAEQLSNEVINSAKDIQARFAEKLDTLSQLYISYIADLKANTEKQVSDVADIYKQQATEINDLLQVSRGLSEANERLIGRVDAVDFPARLDKISQNVEQAQEHIARVDSFTEELKINTSKSFESLNALAANHYSENLKSNNILQIAISQGVDAIQKDNQQQIADLKAIIADTSEQQRLVLDKQTRRVSALRRTIVLMIILFLLVAGLNVAAYLYFNGYIAIH